MSISIYNLTRSYSKEEEKAFSARVSEALAVLLDSSYIDKRLSSGDCDVSADIKLVGSAAIKKLNAEHRGLDKVTDVLNVGDEVKVRLDAIDDKGRLSLSMKRVEQDK